jgi:hypothetical protein
MLKKLKLQLNKSSRKKSALSTFMFYKNPIKITVMSQSRFIIKLKVLLPHALVTVADFAILCRPFDFIALKTLNYLAFQSFDFEHTT